jgi:acyl-CoA synthetase (AMP-forming)/AMP-acid ligase II
MGQLSNAWDYLLDRRLASGIWVLPTEAEDRLLAHPAVGQAIVVGTRDSDGLEKPVAYAILSPGATSVSEDELIEHCLAGLPSFKRPRVIMFTDALPTTATGKVRRVELRELATAVLTPPARRIPPAKFVPS